LQAFHKKSATPPCNYCLNDIFAMPGVAVESTFSMMDDPWISSTLQSLRRVLHAWNNRTVCDLLSSSVFFGWSMLLRRKQIECREKRDDWESMRLTTKGDITEKASFGQRTPICEGDATAKTILDAVKNAPESSSSAEKYLPVSITICRDLTFATKLKF
jgi:hypothetical protein